MSPVEYLIRLQAVPLILAGSLLCILTGCLSSGSHPIVIPANGDITTVAGNGVVGYAGDGGVATSAKLFAPNGVAVDSAGNIYIADSGNDRIRKVTASTGIISTVAGVGAQAPYYNGDGIPATSAQLNNPTSVAVDSAGNIYIGDQQNARIRIVAAASSSIRNGVSYQAGYIYTVAGNGTPGYSGDGGDATSAELAGPTGVALDSAGNIYIADFYRIRKVTASTGVISTVAGNGNSGYNGDNISATTAELSSTSGVAVDSSGNIYIAEFSDNRIRKVTASTGFISTVAGNGTAGYNGDNISATTAELSYPVGVSVDSAGNLYIADSDNERIRIVTASTGVITTVAGNGTLGYSGDGGAATSAELHFPTEAATDSAGNLYLVDSENERIRIVNPK